MYIHNFINIYLKKKFFVKQSNLKWIHWHLHESDGSATVDCWVVSAVCSPLDQIFKHDLRLWKSHCSGWGNTDTQTIRSTKSNSLSAMSLTPPAVQLYSI